MNVKWIPEKKYNLAVDDCFHLREKLVGNPDIYKNLIIFTNLFRRLGRKCVFWKRNSYERSLLIIKNDEREFSFIPKKLVEPSLLPVVKW